MWILKPERKKGWSYGIHVIFDINEYYGPNMTQTFLPDKPLITISTIIGTVTTRSDQSSDDGITQRNSFQSLRDRRFMCLVSKNLMRMRQMGSNV